MNAQTVRRLLTAMQTPGGRAHYRQALRYRAWQFLGSLPWEMQPQARLSGELPIWLSTKDQVISRAIFATGEWEPHELTVLRHYIKPGMVAFDVGANMGVHSLTMGQLVGPSGAVHSFEPTRVFGRLQRNIELNGFQSRVHLNNCAVGRSKGTIRLMDTKPGSELFTSRSTPLDPAVGLEKWIEYPRICLDDYCDEHGITNIDFLKVDIEGGEPDVLAGAAKLLSGGRVGCLLFELNDVCLVNCGESSDQLLDAVVDYGFRLHILDARGFHERPQSLDGLVLNVLATPANAPVDLPVLVSVP